MLLMQVGSSEINIVIYEFVYEKVFGHKRYFCFILKMGETR